MTPAKFLPLRWSCVAVTKYDGGENKQGESGTTKIATECSYYQLTIDGKEVIEIDVVNMVMKVDGVDRLAEHRRAIGL
jgi:P2 family phage contractile tail tube protein